jgi:hypothetical protein
MVFGSNAKLVKLQNINLLINNNPLNCVDSFMYLGITVAIDTPGGNLSLKIKSRAQQMTLKPNIVKVKHLLANVLLFTIQPLQSNLN